MTHTIEAAQIARTLARRLGVNDELAEVITLAHDLGHPPFGHAGEAALDELMAEQGGFNHNAHSLRVVEYLEHPYPAFRGLNLTRATLDGLHEHSTRYDAPSSAGERSSVEGKVASLADRVAYNLHDLEDAIGADWIQRSDLSGLALWRQAEARSNLSFEKGALPAIRRSVLDAMLGIFLADAMQRADQPDAALSPGTEAQLVELERFLAQRVYRHPEVVATDARGQRMIRMLFDAFVRKPPLLPKRFSSRIEELGVARVVCDYIAGMTDRFCDEQVLRIAGR
jgi:dGTPase